MSGTVQCWDCKQFVDPNLINRFVETEDKVCHDCLQDRIDNPDSPKHLKRRIFEHLAKSRRLESEAAQHKTQGLELRRLANEQLQLAESCKAESESCLIVARDLEKKLNGAG